MKKILSIMLAMMLIVTSFGAVSVFAASTDPVLTVSSVTAKPGDTIEITVKLTNADGVSGINYSIKFDKSVLTPVSVEAGSAIENMIEAEGVVAFFASNVEGESGNRLSTLSEVTGTFVTSVPLETDTVIATYVFEIDDDATAGTYDLKVKTVETADREGNPLTTAKKNGSVTVRGSGSGLGGGVGGSGIPAISVVRLNLGNGQVQTVSVPRGSVLEAPAAPSRDGYIFAGWYADAALTERFVFGEKITTSIDLYAKWMPADTSVQYTDIKGHWAEANIIALSDKKIFTGYPDGTFKPDLGITRQEMAVALVKMLSLESELGAGNVSQFADSENIGSWAAPYVELLVKKGIYTGYTDGTFKPTRVITREEMCVLLSKIAGSDISGKATFADLGTTTSLWAEGYVAAMQKAGVVTGYPDNTFLGVNGITRAEACTMLMNFMARF